MINEQCIKYTGYTLPELYYMCSDYIHKYKAWKEARKEQKRRKKEQEEAKRLGKPIPPNIGGSMDDLEDVLMEGG